MLSRNMNLTVRFTARCNCQHELQTSAVVKYGVMTRFMFVSNLSVPVNLCEKVTGIIWKKPPEQIYTQTIFLPFVSTEKGSQKEKSLDSLTDEDEPE